MKSSEHEKTGLNPCSDASFLEAFCRQYEQTPAYRDYCNTCQITPASIRHWEEIPLVPQALFKEPLWLATFPPELETGWFETSGTTTAIRGRRPYSHLAPYKQACVAGFRMAFPECNSPPTFLFLKEPPRDAPHSSLSWMFEFWREELGLPDSHYCWENGEPLVDPIRQAIGKGQPLFLAGTALAFLRLMELNPDGMPLPQDSWILETGGFKGRRHTLDKTAFYGRLSACFHLPDSQISNEYGMTELFSQAYARGAKGRHHFPPWFRFLIIDPTTQRPVEGSKPGLIALYDLASKDCVMGLLTEDIGIRHGNTLELLGRVSTELRGCSLSVES